MATIEKIDRLQGVVYKAKVRKQGHPTVTRSFKTRRAAERWAHKYEADMLEADAGLVVEAQRHTLNDAIKKFRGEILPTLSVTARPTYTGRLDYWSDQLGHLKLAEISATKIAACRDALTGATEDNPAGIRKPATLAGYLATLASVLTACVEQWHWLSVSPMRGVKKPAISNRRERFLDHAELHRLLDACRASTSPDLLLVVMMAVSSGARRSEILNLRWTNIDLAQGVMILRADNANEKKGDTRSAPIAPEALEMLKARKAAVAAKRNGKVAELRPSDLVFPSRVSDGQPVDLRKPWETALKVAGIQGFRFHDLRHSAASFLAAGGASLLEIGAVLGHKSAQTTKRYSHLTEGHIHEVVRKMNDDMLKKR